MVCSIVSLVFERTQYARVAQLVERDLAKVEAAGSSPVSRFFIFAIQKTDAVLYGLASVFCMAMDEKLGKII